MYRCVVEKSAWPARAWIAAGALPAAASCVIALCRPSWNGRTRSVIFGLRERRRGRWRRSACGRAPMPFPGGRTQLVVPRVMCGRGDRTVPRRASARSRSSAPRRPTSACRHGRGRSFRRRADSAPPGRRDARCASAGRAVRRGVARVAYDEQEHDARLLDPASRSVSSSSVASASADGTRSPRGRSRPGSGSASAASARVDAPRARRRSRGRASAGGPSSGSRGPRSGDGSGAGRAPAREHRGDVPLEVRDVEVGDAEVPEAGFRCWSTIDR